VAAPANMSRRVMEAISYSYQNLNRKDACSLLGGWAAIGLPKKIERRSPM
jgi:hypothetical protein